ncbi:MAG: hypothetical protein WA864_00570 [Acetobacteraceae bacterium]
MSQLPAIGGLYVLDDDTMQARRATFDELPAKARAATFGYELLMRKPQQDFFALIARGDSCLWRAGIKPKWVRMPRELRGVPSDEIRTMAAESLIAFSEKLTTANARKAERLVYSLATAMLNEGRAS